MVLFVFYVSRSVPLKAFFFHCLCALKLFESLEAEQELGEAWRELGLISTHCGDFVEAEQRYLRVSALFEGGSLEEERLVYSVISDKALKRIVRMQPLRAGTSVLCKSIERRETYEDRCLLASVWEWCPTVKKMAVK